MLTGLKAWNVIKKRLQHRCFPVIIAKILRIAFLQNTSGGCFLNICGGKKRKSWLGRKINKIKIQKGTNRVRTKKRHVFSEAVLEGTKSG